MQVTRLVQVYDVGRAINPTLVEGQIEGGAMMGLGLGVLENCYPYYPSAEHRGGQFGSYLAPGIEDLPKIDTIIIENPSADGPYGAKGIGEMANNAQPPAIAAAVYDAVGVWVTELPITPERVLRALEAKARASRARGKRVVFDEELSRERGLAAAGSRFEVPALMALALRDAGTASSPTSPLPGRGAPRDRRRAGVPLPRHVRARDDGRAPQPRAHRAGDVDRRRLGDDDDRRRDA